MSEEPMNRTPSQGNRQKSKERYIEKLRDPRWQKMRLEILSRDEWKCQICGDNESTLNVHHRWYERGSEPWEAKPEALVTLCESCHQHETDARPDEESELLRSIKKKFFAFELCQIVKILDAMPIRNVTEVQLTGVAWFLSHPENVDRLMESYFDRKCPLPGESPRPTNQ